MDIKVNTRESGTGETLILLHGNGEDSSYFEPQIAFFSAYYHVLAIDSRGHGKTPVGEKPITLTQFAEDLHDFLIEQKISSAHILGFSDGANIAMLFALKYPEMISSLILYGGNINPSGVKTGLQIQTCICYALACIQRKKNPLKADILGLMVKEPHISIEELNTIQCKTLVISGTKDMIKENHTKQIASAIPHSELAFIEGSHFVSEENPEKFNETVYQFLQKIRDF